MAEWRATTASIARDPQIGNPRRFADTNATVTRFSLTPCALETSCSSQHRLRTPAFVGRRAGSPFGVATTTHTAAVAACAAELRAGAAHLVRSYLRVRTTLLTPKARSVVSAVAATTNRHGLRRFSRQRTGTLSLGALLFMTRRMSRNGLKVIDSQQASRSRPSTVGAEPLPHRKGNELARPGAFSHPLR